ncbi:hypothetical protein HYS50_00465 [Candidatus Woesearchaeota archaeon]|nr:hypothetical protein [Candidatus Woesearchaeota archaeon]
MRFRHLPKESLDTKVAKTDEKAVARTQLLQSKEWQDHITEHHSTGTKPQLIAVTTVEDSGLFKKTEEKKEEKEEQPKPQHTVNHSQLSSNPRAGYVGNAPESIQRNPGDEYFGAGSTRLQAISGQCSCGMEITIGAQPGMQTVEQQLRSGYATGVERQQLQEQQAQPLYTTAQQPSSAQQPLYSTAQPSPSGTQERRRRTTAL